MQSCGLGFYKNIIGNSCFVDVFHSGGADTNVVNLAGILQGGYFVYSSAVLTALMVVAITIYILRNKERHTI